jgi:hypothetical protein
MNDPQIKITRLRLTNWRGIKALDVPIGPGGVLFSGTNGEGKTSALEAVNAALEAVGIGADAIRLGADKAEILVDLDKIEESQRTHLEVARTISKSGTRISVTGSDGVALPKAKEQLSALFGGRALDPLRFLLADPKEQRKIVLAANPVKVTAEDLIRWTGEDREWVTEGHGHEVIARVREMYFNRRTEAGRVKDQAKAAVAIKAQEAEKLRVESPEQISPEAARTHFHVAERDIAVLRERLRQVEERESATVGTRERIAALRVEAEGLITSELQARRPEIVIKLGIAREVKARAAEEVARCRAALAKAEDALACATTEASGLEAVDTQAAAQEAKANALVAQANELEASLTAQEAGGDRQALTAQLATAEETLQQATARVAVAEQSFHWRNAQAYVQVAQGALMEADREWTRLNAIVKRLSEDAPAELSARGGTIPGLEVTSDVIKLDGKSLDLLCGAEKMRFAVTLAKRVAGKAKILTIDGLEALAPSKQSEFVRMAVEDGFMLFATVVADGPMVVIDAYQFAGQQAS